MADLAIITPSRGRPERLEAMLRAAIANAATELEVWIGLDQDDTSYYGHAIDCAFANGADVYTQRLPRRSLSSWSNLLTERCLRADAAPRYLASLGDDHMVRTAAWDKRLMEAIERLEGPGFAYGNDLLQGHALPTAWMVSAEAVRSLGWLMLPSCEHMYVDNAIKMLGEQAGRIAYVPGVIIEHVHPNAGKAELDDSYRASNALEQYRRDGAAFETWRDGQLDRDASTLRALIHEKITN